MRLYLASYAKVTINKVIANENMDFGGKTAIFIPTAGDPYENKDFVEADRLALEDSGMKVHSLDIKSVKNVDAKKMFLSATLVLVAGGDTFYLMDWLRKSGMDKVLKDYIENNGLYVGSSAGSIVCCPTIEGAVEFDDPGLAPELSSLDGLGVFPGVIIPHAHKEKYFERIRRASKKLKGRGFDVFSLTDDDVLFYDGKNTKCL